MGTRRDCSAITKKTRYRWSPASVSTSTVNRSQAVRPSPCACRNVFPGMRRLRSGAGSIPWSCRPLMRPVRLEFPILSLNRGLRSRCVSPDVWPTLSRA